MPATARILLLIVAGLLLPRLALPQGRALVSELGCGNCHQDLGVSSFAQEVAPILGVNARRSAGWLFEYLQRPTRVRTNIGPARMPDFRLSAAEALALVLYVQTLKDPVKEAGPPNLNLGSLQELDGKFGEARRAHPAVDAALGERIFVSLNCAACHRNSSVNPRTNAAPSLLAEGARVQPEWLTNFLQRPTPVRPFGYHPGDGSRMPDFRLSKKEVEELAGVILSASQPTRTVTPKKISRFSMAKAHTLLTEKFSCMGCHQIGTNGGRIGPDLTHVRRRLSPAYVIDTVSNPRAVNPQSIMPKAPLTKNEVELIVSFLWQNEQMSPPAEYLSLVENPVANISGTRTPHEGLYQRLCASCHGLTGFGNGFNARFLPHRPTAHSDGAAMSSRPDDTLYDGIHSGGSILNKSHTMPAWGETLSPAQISGLVKYIRELCRCEEPPWARKGGK